MIPGYELVIDNQNKSTSNKHDRVEVVHPSPSIIRQLGHPLPLNFRQLARDVITMLHTCNYHLVLRTIFQLEV